MQRLRQLYAQPTPDVMIAALAMDPEEVRARMDLAESAAAADASILGDVRAALVGLRVAEDAMRRRKQELAGRTRFLAARDAMAAAGLARARDAQPPTATPQPVTGTTKPGVSRGLPAGVVRDHTLPGAAPVDRATGRPISFAAPAANTVVVPAVGTPSRMVLRTGWYSPAGRITTSGDVFTPDGLTAAHRTLPLGTRLRLFYGSREVVVRINDRGPFVPGQDLDVSPAAAGALGLNRVTTLRAEVVR
ncbi:MAG: septal ring lytic transglycosylase RlpA family protein [Thermoleophilia bacterium]